MGFGYTGLRSFLSPTIVVLVPAFGIVADGTGLIGTAFAAVVCRPLFDCGSFGLRHASKAAPFSRDIIGDVLLPSEVLEFVSDAPLVETWRFVVALPVVPFRLEAPVVAFEVAFAFGTDPEGDDNCVSFPPGEARALAVVDEMVDALVAAVAFALVPFVPFVAVLVLALVVPRFVSFRALSFLPRVIVALTRRSKTW